MPCFCEAPAEEARNSFNPGLDMPLPPPPPALAMTAAMPALLQEERLDMEIAASLEETALPTIAFGGGPMAGIAMSVSMMSGDFAFGDPPLLEMQMEQAAASLESNIWPRLGWLAEIKTQPLLNYAMVARLALDLQAMGLDPFTMEAPPPPDMSAPSMAADFNFALTPPEVSMARTLAGLPPLMQMTATLDLPPLGDPDAIPAMAGQLDGLAQLTPPHLAIPMPTLTKLAMVMNSLGKIEAAFDDPFSPATLERMETMLGIWSAFPLPLPLSSLALQQKLEALPAMEDIQLGEQIAAENSATLAAPFTPPSLPIMPFLNVTAALSASMQASLDMPVFDQCSACCCA